MPDISRPADFHTHAVAMDYFYRARWHPSCWKVPYLYRYPENKTRFMPDKSGKKLETGYAKRPVWDLDQYPVDPWVFVPQDWRDEIEFIKRRAHRATEWEQYELGATRTKQAGYSWLFKNNDDFQEFEKMIRREIMTCNELEVKERVKIATSRFKEACSVFERDNPFSAPRESSGEFGEDSGDSSLTMSDDSRLEVTDSSLSMGGPESHYPERDWQEYTLINGLPVINGIPTPWDNIPTSRPVHRVHSDTSFESENFR